MALVNYDETDTEDEGNKVWSSSTNRGGSNFCLLRGSTIGQPALLEQRFCSATPRGIQVTNLLASPVVSHGSDPIFLDGESKWKKTPGEVNANETTVGGVKRKVLSMDLAMQREITYKKKMEGLQKQNCNELQDPPKTVQGVISNARTVGIKRQAPVTDSSCPALQQAMKSYCQQPSQSQPLQFCKECNVMCSGTLNLEMHYRGKKHKAKLEELKNQKDGIDMGTTPLECSLCKIPCMNERCLREHLAGKKHAACLQAVKAASKDKHPEEVRNGRV